MSRPKTSIKQFIDLGQFLNTYAQDMKIQNPRWSIGVWHSKLKVGSRTVLVKILNGQRVPGPKIAKALIDYFKFDEEEVEHFQSLIQLKKHSTTQKMREAILARLQKIEEPVLTQGFDKTTRALLAHWSHLPLLAMLNCPAFPQDPKILSKMFVKNVSQSQVDRAIESFIESGLIKKTRKGRFEITKDWQMFRPVALVPQDIFVAQARAALFRQQLRLASSLLGKIPQEESDLRTTCVTIKRSDVPYARELIRKFTQSFSRLMNKDQEASHVYQLQVQFFPIASQ